MSDDVATAVRGMLAELASQMPMSEAEFRYRLEPLRAERESAVRALVDLLGEDPPLPAAATAALHELATAADADALVLAFRDVKRPERARTEIAQVLSAIAADRLEEILEPQELRDLSLLSIDTLLERLCDRAGTAQVVELYRESNRRERRALLDAITSATERPKARARLGAAFDPLFAHEPDEGLRSLMIRRVAGRTEPASARALSRWLGHAHGAERRRVLEGLRRLQHVGIRPAARGLEAWVSGVDATGSFNVGISFPAALELRDIVLACISVDAGLRAVNVITAVGAETTREIGRALEEDQSIPVAPIDVPRALHHIEAARQRTIGLGRTLPDGFQAAAPYLHRPLAVARAADRAAPTPAVPSGPLAALIDSPAYSSWTFGGAELVVPRSLAGHEPPSSARLRAAARMALRGLEGSPAAERLVAMLRHQSEVHRLRSETALAARSLAVAGEIAEKGLAASGFARRMIERSVVASLIRGPKSPRAEVRDAFKRQIEEGAALRRHAVAVLDLAEALYRQLENSNEAAAPGDRIALAEMETLALGAARLVARELARDASEQSRLPGMELAETAPPSVVRRRIRADATRVRLEREISGLVGFTTGVESDAAARIAAALVGAARWFADEVCLRRCRRGCLSAPDADGRALFFERGHPAGFEFGPSPAAEGRGAAGGAALAQHIARRVEEQIAVGDSFLAALEHLGLPARGESRSRARRAADLVERLRVLAQEVRRVEEDPAWLYALVEETEAIAREIRSLARLLLGSALGRLEPEPGQLAGFTPYPRARLAWRGLERQTRRLGLIGLPLGALHAAIDRLDGASSLTALFRAAAEPASAAAFERLAAASAEFWMHTPRSALASKTPAQAHGLEP